MNIRLLIKCDGEDEKKEQNIICSAREWKLVKYQLSSFSEALSKFPILL